MDLENSNSFNSLTLIRILPDFKVDVELARR